MYWHQAGKKIFRSPKNPHTILVILYPYFRRKTNKVLSRPELIRNTKTKNMFKTNFTRIALFAFLLLSAQFLAAQMKTYTWDPYKTKFSVPSDFRVNKSTGDYWSGTNDDITLSIYPRKGENLSYSKMKTSLYQWAVDCNLEDIGAVTELDSDKLNGYWGVMHEGYSKGFPVAVMLIVDPDYPDISLYIWVSYREGLEDDVIDLLMSFTPN